MPGSDKYIKVFEDCRLVVGAFKSTIYDFSRKKYHPITKRQGEILSQLDKKPVNEFEKVFGSSDGGKEFIDFLFEEEIIFVCTKEELAYFPEIKNQWYSSSTVSNLLLFRSEQSNNNFIEKMQVLEELGLKHVQLFIESEINFSQLKHWIESISQISIKSIEIFISREHANVLLEDANELIHTQVITVTVTGSSEFRILKRESGRPFNIMFIRNAFSEIFESAPSDPNYFHVDIRQYMESQNFNTYFNEKLVIDSSDNILVNVNDDIIGHLNNVDLEDLVNSKAFKSLAQVNKDSIEVCKDCEYRYMCNDSRTPRYLNGKWEYDEQCYYNPYSGEWNLKMYEEVS